MENKNVNWKSPTFWPMINWAAKMQVEKSNLVKIVRTLREWDPQFELLSHQQLSDWHDKTQNDKLVWSEKTLLEVKKGFLPGGQQTCFNVFVSFLYIVYKSITNPQS